MFDFDRLISVLSRLAHAESDRANADRYLGESIRLLARAISSRHEVGKFIITQAGAAMNPNQGPLLGVPAGGSATFSATYFNPDGSQGALPAGIVALWKPLDPSIGTITPDPTDPTGLTVGVSLLASAPVGTTVSLQVGAVLADGTTPVGSADLPVLPVVVPPPQTGSFVITQNASVSASLKR